MAPGDHRWDERSPIGRDERCLVERASPSGWRIEEDEQSTALFGSREEWGGSGPRRLARRDTMAAGTPTPEAPVLPAPLEVLFEDLADQWISDTAFESVVVRKAMHPAYQRIIGMGAPVVPLIIRRLRRAPHQWFWALTAITGDDPARGMAKPREAAEAWIAWSDERSRSS